MTHNKNLTPQKFQGDRIKKKILNLSKKYRISPIPSVHKDCLIIFSALQNLAIHETKKQIINNNFFDPQLIAGEK